MLFCAVILDYVILMKKDYESTAIAFIGIFMLLEGVYYYWQFYKKNDTIKFDDKF